MPGPGRATQASEPWEDWGREGEWVLEGSRLGAGQHTAPQHHIPSSSPEHAGCEHAAGTCAEQCLERQMPVFQHRCVRCLGDCK